MSSRASTRDLTPFGEMVHIIDDLAVIALNARRAQRLSQRDLAGILGVSPSTVCRIEEGREYSSVSLRAVLLWLDGKAAS